MEEEKQLFDRWYKEQKEMTPYIMRDYFLSRINLAVSKERERIVEELKQGLLNRMMKYDSKDGYSIIHDEVLEKVSNDVDDILYLINTK